jgi:hypothetical protein
MKNKNLVTIILVIIIAVVGYKLLTMPDQRTTGQRLGDAVDTLNEGKGIDKAAEQLEKRTPGEKLGDAIKDNTDGK